MSVTSVTRVPSVLNVRDVDVARGGRHILDDVRFDARRGEVVALMGASGSGKTTLLRAIAGLDSFQSGQIVVDSVLLEGGRAASRETLVALRRKVGMVFQFHCLFEHLSALDNVCLAPVYAHGVPPAEAK